MIGDDLKKSVRQSLGRTKRATDAFLKADPSSDLEALPLFQKVVDEWRRLSSDGVIDSLEAERKRLKENADKTLQRRREDLHKAARETGWMTNRFQDFDRIDCFRVEYRKRVIVRLGSERYDEFDEMDGRKLFNRLQKARLKLQKFPFVRDDFFIMVKDAVRFAGVLELSRDGKVPIRKIYPLCVLVRQSRNEKFVQNPNDKNFQNYSICQFIYDMARFGQSGWSGGQGERLASQTPNMESVVGGKAFTLPSLDGSEAGAQLATLWIEKS